MFLEDAPWWPAASLHKQIWYQNEGSATKNGVKPLTTHPPRVPLV